MALIDLFPARVAFVDANGRLTTEAFRALQGVLDRVGGTTGASTTDLAISDDEDSGLEEFKHETSKALDGLAMQPASVFEAFTDPLHPLPQEHVDVQHILSELAGLREEVARLRAEVQGIQEGTML